LRPGTPEAVDRILKACLAKDPDERWNSAYDLKKEFEWILKGELQPGVSDVKQSRVRGLVGWAVAACLLAVIVGREFFNKAPSAAAPTGQFSISPPEQSNFDFFDSPVAVSPDGKYLVFGVGPTQGPTSLWIRPLDSISARKLQGTDGGTTPFWSPDSRFVGFFAHGKLKVVDINGTSVQEVCEAVSRPGGTWNKDGVIVLGDQTDCEGHRCRAAEQHA
jgi:hypothetical protein